MPFVPFNIGRLPYGNTIDPDRLRQMADFLNAMVDVNSDFLLGDVTIGRGGGKVYTNAALGRDVLRLNTTGTNNTGVGNLVLTANTTGSFNTGLGNLALTANTTGSNNTAFGSEVLSLNTTGDNNTAYGFNALKVNTTGSALTAFGYQCLIANTTGGTNTAVGYQCMVENTTGFANSAFGRESLQKNTTGSHNTGSGNYSLQNNTTGTGNVSVGYLSLAANTTGSNNVAIGEDAGSYQPGTIPFASPLESPENSIYIGFASRGFSNSDDNAIVIGYQAIGEGANTTVIGNSSTTAAHIYGAVTVGGLVIDDAKNIVLNTTTGTKIGTATSQKLGLWNATPVVQPTTAVTAAAFTANSSGIADDTATFGGYTIGQIVAALKAIGALA